MSMVQIRPAISTDAVGLAQLISDLGYPTESRELWTRIEIMPKETYHTLVAVMAGKVVGFIGLLTLPVYEHTQPIGWILALSVSPANRRQGIGKALIIEAEAYYKSRDVTDVRLHSGLQREDAHEFYEKLNYLKSGYRFKKRL